MKKQLEAKGWIMFSECKSPCAKQHFSNPTKKGYEIRVKTTSQTFSIMLDNMVVSGPHWAYQLDEKLISNGLI